MELDEGRTPIQGEPGHFGNPFAWTGQRYDAGVRLYDFYFRFYSVSLGRWNQRDRLMFVDGISLYEYVRSTPLVVSDPFGLELRVGGTPKQRKLVEDMLRKLCPGARVNPKTGEVTIEKEPEGDDKCSSQPSTQPSPSKGCQDLQKLIDSKKRYVVNVGGKTSGSHKPGETRDNIEVRMDPKPVILNTDGTEREQEFWEVLWHELVHAVRREEGRNAGIGTPREERETIEETNQLLDEYNQGRPPGEQVPHRDPGSHDYTPRKKRP